MPGQRIRRRGLAAVEEAGTHAEREEASFAGTEAAALGTVAAVAAACTGPHSQLSVNPRLTEPVPCVSTCGEVSGTSPTPWGCR